MSKCPTCAEQSIHTKEFGYYCDGLCVKLEERTDPASEDLKDLLKAGRCPECDKGTLENSYKGNYCSLICYNNGLGKTNLYGTE